MIPQTTRRPGAGPNITTIRRQPRPADPDLVNLDQRLEALEALGDTRSHRWAVALLRRRHGWLVRDQGAGGSTWATDAANLRLAVEREERYRA
jgi:hypothetical protein